jgi:hypothetical protein
VLNADAQQKDLVAVHAVSPVLKLLSSMAQQDCRFHSK